MPSRPGRRIPSITVDMFGGTVCSCFWVTGNITSLWVWLHHYDRSLSCQGHHWTSEGHSGQAEGCLKIEPGGNIFHLPSVMWMSSMLRALKEALFTWYGCRISSPWNWAVRPLLWWMKTAATFSALTMTVLHSVRWTFLVAGAGFLLLEVRKSPPKFRLWRLAYKWRRSEWQFRPVLCSPGVRADGGWESWGEQNRTVLLYLKCFLTSFCTPVKGPASSVWLGHVPVTAPLPLWCGSWFPVLLATLAFLLTCFSSPSSALPLKPTQVSFLLFWFVCLFSFLLLFY